MATIDLSLDALKIPALDNFTPDFGTMITETQANKGGLSTFEVNSNMMLPWAYMRPKVVVEDSVTTVVQYDAKLTFSASLQAGVTLTMDAGDYEGCEVSLRNLSAYACTVGHGTFSLEIPAGGFVRIIWNGTTWEADVSSAVGSGIILPPTAAAVHAAIGGIYDVAPHFLTLKERGVVWSDWTATNTGLTVFSCSSSHSQIFSIHFYINNNFICSCESVGYQPTIITVPIKQGDVIKINAPDDPNWFKTYIAISECLFY